MGKAVLCVGKDLPEGNDFADALITAGYAVAATYAAEAVPGRSAQERLVALKWNRTSPISARSIVLETENAFAAFDAVVLYFDAPFLSAEFTSCTVEDVSHALDALIAGFQYVATESLARFLQKQRSGTVVFVLKTHPSLADAARSPSVRQSTIHPAGPLVAAAQAAFSAFAENYAVLAADRRCASVVLVQTTAQSETGAQDASLAAWLADYLATNAEKNKSPARVVPVWIKAGAKSAGLFARFR
ncbi:MAG: hypothetical protein IJ191_00670 [Treponema sp.]|nr:hypothetical protein [Treponema sp.]